MRECVVSVQLSTKVNSSEGYSGWESVWSVYSYLQR